MRRYTPTEIVAFLQAFDADLTSPMEVMVIGGSVLGLAYQIDRATQDLDVLDSNVFAAAVSRRTRPPAVLVQPVTIAEMPYDYLSRAVQVLHDLRYLRVLVPESHDFALSKLAAGRMNDFQAVEDVHHRQTSTTRRC